MDGGSLDNSVEIVKQYESLLIKGDWEIKCNGVNFRWQSGKDKGQTDALMKGFSMAEGEIFAWLNSDDIYLPGALQKAADILRNCPEITLLYGDAYFCDLNGEEIPELHRQMSIDVPAQGRLLHWMRSRKQMTSN